MQLRWLPHLDGDYRIWFGATLGQTILILILMTRFTGTTILSIRHQDAINSGFPSSFVCQTRVIICCVECLTGRHSFGNTHLIPRPTICILPSTSMRFFQFKLMPFNRYQHLSPLGLLYSSMLRRHQLGPPTIRRNLPHVRGSCPHARCEPSDPPWGRRHPIT